MGHRMRHIRTQAVIIRRGLEAGLDPKDMPVADNLFPKDQNKIDPGTRSAAANDFLHTKYARHYMHRGIADRLP